MKITSYFDYFQPTAIKSGSGSRILAPTCVQELGGKRVILFSDKGLTAVGLTEEIAALFERDPGVELVAVFDEIEQDAKSSIINKAIQVYKDVNADSIVTIGGGSVMDTAKAVKWAIHNKVSNIEIAVMGVELDDVEKIKPFPIPHISIPTTAGTGSEVSAGAVILNEVIGVKCNLVNPFISANIAILDPDVTVGLPAKITAFTGMDALTHAIEGYFAVKSNAFTDALALHATRLIKDNIKTAVHEGTNLAARANMLQASTMAIQSFIASAGLYPVHNLAHAYGAKYHIPHGLANAIFLPVVLKNMPDFYLEKVAVFAEALGVKANTEDPREVLQACIDEINAIRENIDLPADFKEYNIDPEDIPALIAAVHSDPIGMAFRIPEQVIVAVSEEVIQGNKQTSEHV